MKAFKHFNARTVEEAAELLSRYAGKAAVIAGGTDLLGKMKDRILPDYPEALVNIKTIPGLDKIEEDGGELRIGALARLHDVAVNETVARRYTALSMAAGRAASPNLRHLGTIGGNVCQDIRCWYYRSPDNRFSCLRKGGGRCYAIKGDNRYHSIFGGSVEGGCYAVHPGDVAPALVALNAKVITNKRTLAVEDFFQVKPSGTTVLRYDEILHELRLPTPEAGAVSSFVKFSQRKSIDFPVVNCAVVLLLSGGKVAGARVCMNAVSVTPRRARESEEALRGQPVNEETAEKAGAAAVAGAKPLEHNRYIVQIARTMVKRAVLACGE